MKIERRSHFERYHLQQLVRRAGGRSSGQFDPEMIVEVRTEAFTEQHPVVSFVVPVFNQEERIVACLSSIERNATGVSELIVVDDASADGTRSQVLRWMNEPERRERGRLISVTLVSLDESVFETLCDMVGIALARARHVIEIQADMLIDDRGFDERMLGHFRNMDDLMLVSGRGAHSWSLTGVGATQRRRLPARIHSLLARKITERKGKYRPSRIGYRWADQVGRVGPLVEYDATPSGDLYLHETVMRGPYAIDVAKFLELGGFDTSRFFLGNDDHDLAFRAWRDKRYRVGYMPVRFDSPLESGSTRRERPPAEERRYEQLRQSYGEAAEGSALAMRGAGIPSPGARWVRGQ